MATGFHGAHVIIGPIFLIVCLARAIKGQFTPTQHLGFEFAAWYWHFVDVVWLFLFACIYVWGAGCRIPNDGFDGFPDKGRRQRRPFALKDDPMTEHAPLTGDLPIGRGLRGRCPRCGEGRLFQGFLDLRPRCEHCGLDYGFADAGDGPAVFVILIGGFIVVFAALDHRDRLPAALLGACGAVAAADPDPDAGAAAADQGADDRPAISSQGAGRPVGTAE